jgi:hypothetical protein
VNLGVFGLGTIIAERMNEPQAEERAWDWGMKATGAGKPQGPEGLTFPRKLPLKPGSGIRKLKGRAAMSQVITPEEMASLLAGLREAEDAQDPEFGAAPPEIISRGRNLAEPGPIARCQNISNWLMAITDLWWPH